MGRAAVRTARLATIKVPFPFMPDAAVQCFVNVVQAAHCDVEPTYLGQEQESHSIYLCTSHLIGDQERRKDTDADLDDAVRSEPTAPKSV